MEIFTIEEWEQNFDELFKRVEEGETIGIVREDGTAAVMVPADDEIVRIYTDNNNEAQWVVASLAIWWMQQTHNLPKESSILSGSIGQIFVCPYWL